MGAEVRKLRPCVIVNGDDIGILPLKVIVPLTDWKDRYSLAPWMVRIDPRPTNDLVKPCAADCFQVRSVAQERLTSPAGTVAEPLMRAIEEALKKVLKLK